MAEKRKRPPDDDSGGDESDKYILNPATNRRVKVSGRVGRRLLNASTSEDAEAPEHPPTTYDAVHEEEGHQHDEEEAAALAQWGVVWPIPAEMMRHLVHIRARYLAQSRDRVDAGDALSQERVGRDLGQLGRPQVGREDALARHPLGIDAHQRMDGSHALRVRVPANQYAVRIEQVQSGTPATTTTPHACMLRVVYARLLFPFCFARVGRLETFLLVHFRSTWIRSCALRHALPPGADIARLVLSLAFSRPTLPPPAGLRCAVKIALTLDIVAVRHSHCSATFIHKCFRSDQCRHQPKEFVRGVCRKCIVRKSETGPRSGWECRVCGETGKYYRADHFHGRTPLPPEPPAAVDAHQCTLCRSFTGHSVEAVTAHVWNNHVRKRSACPRANQCRYSVEQFAQCHSLQQHLDAQHSNTGGYRCPMQGKCTLRHCDSPDRHVSFFHLRNKLMKDGIPDEIGDLQVRAFSILACVCAHPDTFCDAVVLVPCFTHARGCAHAHARPLI